MIAIETTPNLAAAQFLPPKQRRRLERLVSRIARHNIPLWKAMQAARKAARADQSDYDDWLCAQAPQFDDDVPIDYPEARRRPGNPMTRIQRQRGMFIDRRGEPMPTVREELAATRIRPMDAPMATRDADSEGEEEAWDGPTGDYQEIPAEMPWAIIGLVVWTWFVFLVGRASV